MENDVNERYSDLTISASECFKKLAYIRFDPELNGLQTGIKRFLTIDFSDTHFIKTLKN